MHIVRVNNLSHPLSQPISAIYCDTFWSRFRGLMFQHTLREDAGILLDEDVESRVNTAIHMLFMNFDLAIIWINSRNFVVDVKLARKWRPFYFPQEPARYILEAHISQLSYFQIGDYLDFNHA